jgi:hypothetical protein
MTSRWRLLVWTAALVLGLRSLHALGAGPLGVPLGSVHDLSAWIDRAPPEVMALALVRLAALAGGWYLAAWTLILALVRPFAPPRLVAAVARMAPGVVCRVVAGGGGIGVAVGALLGGLPSTMPAANVLSPTPAAAAPADPSQEPGASAPTATMTRVGHDTPTATTTRVGHDTPTATMTRVGHDTPTATTTRVGHDTPTATMTGRPVPAAPPVDAPASTSRPSPSPSRSSPTSGDRTTASPWIVEAGDSFWSIAAETVSRSGDGAPDVRGLVGYWRRLIEANRHRLLDPANPDLLVPGQELVLPDPAR